MDAGKIKSFTPSINLRAHADPQSPRRSEAGAVAAKLAPALLLDALANVDTGAASDALIRAPVVTTPRGGVIVHLTLPVVSALQELQFARAVAGADYSHLDPKKAAASAAEPGVRLDAQAEPSEPLKTAVLVSAAAGAQAVDRAAPTSPSISTSPDVRPDLHPHALALAGVHQQSVAAAEPRNAASAVSQARDTERLAGLAVPPESAASAADPHLAKLILAAIAAGVLVLVLL